MGKTRFFACKFCGKPAAEVPRGVVVEDDGAMHAPGYCDGFARMSAEAYVAHHADAPEIPDPIGDGQLVAIDVNNPDFCKEGES